MLLKQGRLTVVLGQLRLALRSQICFDLRLLSHLIKVITVKLRIDPQQEMSRALHAATAFSTTRSACASQSSTSWKMSYQLRRHVPGNEETIDLKNEEPYYTWGGGMRVGTGGALYIDPVSIERNL